MAQNQELLRALDHQRQRLQNLSSSLSKLVHDLSTSDPLPAWPSIQNSLSLAQHGLLSLHSLMTSEKAQRLLQAAHVHPTPSFPGRTQEPLLEQLLRKKLQPGVEDWIVQGVRHAGAIPGLGVGGEEEGGVESNGDRDGEGDALKVKLRARELEELWDWAGPEANRIARDEIGEGWDDVFTLKESEEGIENVVTGLRRKLWDEEESEDEGDDEAGAQDGDAMDVDEKEEQRKEDPASVESNLQGLDGATRVMMSRTFDEARAPVPLEVVLRYQLTGQAPLPAAGAQLRK